MTVCTISECGYRTRRRRTPGGLRCPLFLTGRTRLCRCPASSRTSMTACPAPLGWPVPVASMQGCVLLAIFTPSSVNGWSTRSTSSCADAMWESPACAATVSADRTAPVAIDRWPARRSSATGQNQNASAAKNGRIGVSSPVLIQNMPKFIAKSHSEARRCLVVPVASSLRALWHPPAGPSLSGHRVSPAAVPAIGRGCWRSPGTS